ncbi:MAG TPA: HEAT repeat domain-containing protein [Bryobacteraceae bacterium]|nr:HEAT repeat domain-containing protein [Bryobacteraceae bacterium]
MKPALLLAFLFIPAVPQTQDSTPVRRARTVLEQGAADPDPDVRREVAVALGLPSRRDPSTNLLAKLAADKDHLVREAALVSIGELRDPRLAKPAQDALEDEVPEVAFAAARTLFKLNQPAGKQLLIEIVQREARGKTGFVRAKLRDAARHMSRPKSAMLFVAQQGVGFVPVPGLGGGFSAMGSLVGDPDFSARATALIVLSSDRSPEVRSQIEQAFNDSDWSMRAAATQIAASRNERSWRFRLVPLFEDTNRRVRYRAAASFLRLSGPAAR